MANHNRNRHQFYWNIDLKERSLQVNAPISISSTGKNRIYRGKLLSVTKFKCGDWRLSIGLFLHFLHLDQSGEANFQVNAFTLCLYFLKKLEYLMITHLTASIKCSLSPVKSDGSSDFR